MSFLLLVAVDVSCVFVAAALVVDVFIFYGVAIVFDDNCCYLQILFLYYLSFLRFFTRRILSVLHPRIPRAKLFSNH